MDSLITNWDSIFETGNAAVDNQHKQLFKLIKQFSLEADKTNNKTVTTSILFELEDYTRNHFAEEEKTLAKLDGLPSNDHLKQHREFIKVLEDLKFDYVSENKKIELELFIFLAQWLKDHILTIDQKELKMLHH